MKNPYTKVTGLRSSPLTAIIVFSIISGCSGPGENYQGKLYIIGGGNKGDGIMNEMVSISGIREKGYMFILPMASSLPDSSLLWARADFSVTGITRMPGFNFIKGEPAPADKIDSLRAASLIYICGGDQSVFMDVVRNTVIAEAIRDAYKNGAIIAGTSAGAAVMSRVMITGNQMKHPGSDAGFTTIESENVETNTGLGLLDDVIIDQHFIKRQRLNRLVAVSVENPEMLCIGIDESTAIIVSGNSAKVSGDGQVVVIKNRSGNREIRDGLLGAEGLEMSIYLPGDEFRIR